MEKQKNDKRYKKTKMKVDKLLLDKFCVLSANYILGIAPYLRPLHIENCISV